LLDYSLEHIWDDLGKPDVFLLDIQPFLKMLVITDPLIAESMTKSSTNWPYAIPKSWTVGDILPLIGKGSILAAEVSDDFIDED
jgi:hypothetical protein